MRKTQNLRGKISSKTKYKIFKEVTIWQGLLDFVLWPTAGYFTGKGWVTLSLLTFLLLGINFYTSSKLSYKVLEMLVKIQNEEVANGNIP